MRDVHVPVFFSPARYCSGIRSAGVRGTDETWRCTEDPISCYLTHTLHGTGIAAPERPAPPPNHHNSSAVPWSVWVMLPHARLTTLKTSENRVCKKCKTQQKSDGQGAKTTGSKLHVGECTKQLLLSTNDFQLYPWGSMYLLRR